MQLNTNKLHLIISLFFGFSGTVFSFDVDGTNAMCIEEPAETSTQRLITDYFSPIGLGHAYESDEPGHVRSDDSSSNDDEALPMDVGSDYDDNVFESSAHLGLSQTMFFSNRGEFEQSVEVRLPSTEELASFNLEEISFVARSRFGSEPIINWYQNDRGNYSTVFESEGCLTKLTIFKHSSGLWRGVVNPSKNQKERVFLNLDKSNPVEVLGSIYSEFFEKYVPSGRHKRIRPDGTSTCRCDNFTCLDWDDR